MPLTNSMRRRQGVNTGWSGGGTVRFWFMNTRMPQGNTDFVERPVISTRVKADGHGGANAKTRQQIIVRIGSSVAPACAGRFIRDKAMFTRNDLLFEAARASVDDNIRRFNALLCVHVQIKVAEFPRSDRDMPKRGKVPAPRRGSPSGKDPLDPSRYETSKC